VHPVGRLNGAQETWTPRLGTSGKDDEKASYRNHCWEQEKKISMTDNTGRRPTGKGKTKTQTT
jgi:hypothetical protein